MKSCRDELTIGFAHSDETGVIHGPVEPDSDELRMAPPGSDLYRIE
ncbi:MAG: hypothetical protein OXD39_05230 [Gemmatimonadetes bacterium]|nr:hypothetical protein [Gemmatimonadota bacterium]